MNNLTLLTDTELVKQFRAGNSSAFDTLLMRYKDRVYTHIYMIVHDRDFADDIFQESFIKAIQFIKLGRYVESGKFLPWINRIAYNLVMDHFRKEKTGSLVSSDDAEYNLLNKKELYENSIEDSIIQEQALTDVVRLIDFLPDVQQEVIRMRFFEELSFKEIADQTGVSINTALGRMRYALLNMRRLAIEHDLSLEMR